MKLELTATAVLAVAGLAVAGYVGWRATRAAGDLASAVSDGVSDAAQAVNPLNPDNIIYSGVNKVGGAIAGSDDWSLGGWIYDVTHKDPMAPALPDLGVSEEGARYDAMGNVISASYGGTGGATGSW